MFLQRDIDGQVFTIPGTLRSLADGAAVETGALLTWIKDGVSNVAAGVLTHVTDGGYTYAPTQNETDCKIAGWVLSKIGAAGLAGSLRTTNADPNDGVRLALTGIIDPLEIVVPGAYAAGTAGYVLGHILSLEINVIGPTNPVTGIMTLIVGDDYYSDESRSFLYQTPVGGNIPDLTGATVTAKWLLSSGDGSVVTTLDCVIGSPGGADQTVTLTVPRATTALLAAGSQYQIAFVATLADGHTVTFMKQLCRAVGLQTPQ